VRSGSTFNSIRRSPRRLAVAAAAGAIALGGCGDADRGHVGAGDPAPRTHDERLASQRVAQFLSAMEAKDDARACTMMTPKLRRAISISLRMDSLLGTCHTRAADIYSPAKAPGNADPRLVQLKIFGSRAKATVTATSDSDLGAGPVESEIVLERRGDQWLIANF
jgi:hypothetical protein